MSKSGKRHRMFTAGRVAKLTRVAVSAVMLLLMTILITSLETRVAGALGWVSRIQLVPLALSGAVTAVVVWLVVTLMFGRVYCSSVCPLGVVQDCFSHLSRITRKRRIHHPYHYSLPFTRLRYVLLTLVAGCAVVGVALPLSLLDPYSAFGRIGSELLRPVVQWLGGAPVIVASWMAFGIAAATLVVVGWMSFRRGRLFCNTICPVGSTLGIFSRYSLFHFEIDTDLCVNCRKCEKVCKSECINLNDHVVDGSRCVACFNCVDACDSDAIRYTTRRKKLALPMMQRIESAPSASMSQPDSPAAPVKIDRRKFLATGAIIAATPAIAALAKGEKRIAAIETGGKPLKMQHAVVPPGRRSMKEFLERCTGCGLCVAHCPAKVLKPSVNELGWLNMMHPVMDYDRSYCRYNCTRCTRVCPTGALLPLNEEEKHVFMVGQAVVESDNCIGCGLCSSRCPRKAITMVARTSGRGSMLVASVNTGDCIGCGACEYICPASPLKAIGVNGIV